MSMVSDLLAQYDEAELFSYLTVKELEALTGKSSTTDQLQALLMMKLRAQCQFEKTDRPFESRLVGLRVLFCDALLLTQSDDWVGPMRERIQGTTGHDV